MNKIGEIRRAGAIRMAGERQERLPEVRSRFQQNLENYARSRGKVRNDPDPNCPRCKIAQENGAVIYCVCLTQNGRVYGL